MGTGIKNKNTPPLSQNPKEKKHPEFFHWLHAISFFFFKMVCHVFQHGILFPIINWGYLLRF
jgi:hypothetical protein